MKAHSEAEDSSAPPSATGRIHSPTTFSARLVSAGTLRGKRSVTFGPLSIWMPLTVRPLWTGYLYKAAGRRSEALRQYKRLGERPTDARALVLSSNCGKRMPRRALTRVTLDVTSNVFTRAILLTSRCICRLA